MLTKVSLSKKKRFRTFFAVGSVVALLFGLFFNTGRDKAIAATDATLQFNQSNISTNVGSILTLVARVNPGTNEVGAVELDVTFNPSILRLDSITRSAPFTTDLFGPVIDNIGTGNTDGNGSIDVGILTTPATYVTTTSNVATFIFTVLGPATNSPIGIAATSNASARGSYVVQTRIGALVTVATPDTTAPTFTVNNGTSATYVQNDVINIAVADASGVASRFYGFSADNICNVGDSIITPFTSGTDFNIAGDHTDYLCVKATDSSSSANVGYQLVGQLRTDNTGPTFTVSDGASATPVKTDTINVTVSDSASGVATRAYGFSSDNICNASDTIATTFTSGVNFSITGDRADYLCLKSTDNVGNIGYQLVGQLRIDNTQPVATQVVAVPAVSRSDNPNYTFSSTEGGVIAYGGGCSSSITTAIPGNNTIVFNALARGANYNCTIRVTDVAGNQGPVINVSSFAVTFRGDLNVDRIVSSNDFTMFASDYGKTDYCGNLADIDGNCTVNSNDFTILAGDYGKSF